jgi:hypothetical protein
VAAETVLLELMLVSGAEEADSAAGLAVDLFPIGLLSAAVVTVREPAFFLLLEDFFAMLHS